MRSFQRNRQLVTLAVRSTAGILLLIGIYGLVQTLVLWRANGSMMIQYERGFTWIGLALGFLACGIALAAASAWLARWLVPPLRNECPQCGYALESLASPRCPECGLHISDQPGVDDQSPTSP